MGLLTNKDFALAARFWQEPIITMSAASDWSHFWAAFDVLELRQLSVLLTTTTMKNYQDHIKINAQQRTQTHFALSTTVFSLCVRIDYGLKMEEQQFVHCIQLCSTVT